MGKSKVGYAYTAGKLSAVTLDGAPFLSAITWESFGPVHGWTQANGSVIQRGYALDGMLTSITLDGKHLLDNWADDQGKIRSVTKYFDDLYVGVESFGAVYDQKGQIFTSTGVFG